MDHGDKLKNTNAAGGIAPNDQSKEIKPSEYIRAIIGHLSNGNQKTAYSIAQAALIEYPDTPLILSYYGSLQACVDKRCVIGIDNCTKAVALLRKKSLREGESVETLFPVLYLNLGRAYMAARKKRNAVEALRKGLQYDKRNGPILKELEGLGSRGKLIVPFLRRSNPINKYLGLVVHWRNQQQEEGRRG